MRISYAHSLSVVCRIISTAKGAIRKIKEIRPNANIVTIDYDPGAPKVNQENRIKLMLAVGKELRKKLEAEKNAEEAESSEKSEKK